MKDTYRGIPSCRKKGNLLSFKKTFNFRGNLKTTSPMAMEFSSMEVFTFQDSGRQASQKDSP
jgi:hypothetical protein